MKPSESEARGAWRHYPQEALEQQYNARATVPDVTPLLQDYRRASDAARALCPQACTLAYGSHPDETLDILALPGAAPGHMPALAPALVFVHGGYWRALGREDSCFMATALRRNGVATVAINYTLAPAARLEDIVAQCRRSLLWLAEHGTQHGIDASRLVLAGSSAGAHLVAMMMASDWQDNPPGGTDAKASSQARAQAGVLGAVLVSGLYDLQPVRLCAPGQWLHLSEAQAEAMSPVTQLPAPTARLAVVVAEQDTAEFKRQSRLYAALAAEHGCAVRWQEITGRNHFDVIMDWMQPDSALSQATLRLFGLTAEGDG